MSWPTVVDVFASNDANAIANLFFFSTLIIALARYVWKKWQSNLLVYSERSISKSLNRLFSTFKQGRAFSRGGKDMIREIYRGVAGVGSSVSLIVIGMLSTAANIYPYFAGADMFWFDGILIAITSTGFALIIYMLIKSFDRIRVALAWAAEPDEQRLKIIQQYVALRNKRKLVRRRQVTQVANP